MGIEAAQKRVLSALLDRHPALIPADALRAELSDVHDIDQALTALIRDGLVTRLGELIGASWIAVRTHRLAQTDQTAGAVDVPDGRRRPSEGQAARE